MTSQKTTAGVIGGGISGLSAAYALQKKGITATVYEHRNQVGGSIRTVKHQDWLIEQGPNTLLIREKWLWELLEELELTKHIQKANPSGKSRYIVKNGSLLPVPGSFIEFLTSSLITTRGKIRLLKEPFVPPTSQPDETISEFITRRLGKEPLDYGVNPFVSGIYAGDPSELSMKHTFNTFWEMEQEHGSLFRAVIKRNSDNSGDIRSLISFDEGNQLLPQRIAVKLNGPVLTQTKVSSVDYNNSEWTVTGIQNNKPFINRHSVLISAVPAYRLPDIFNLENAKHRIDELSALPYASLSVLSLGYRNEDIRHPLDGFGVLIPEKEEFDLLGVLFPSTLFPGRAPTGHKLLTCFIGGARNPGLATRPPEELLDIVQPELHSLLNVIGSPVFQKHTFWDRAIPQYRLDYDNFLKITGEIEENHPGLYLVGSYRNGVSVPDCIASGFETSDKVELFLEKRHNRF